MVYFFYFFLAWLEKGLLISLIIKLFHYVQN